MNQNIPNSPTNQNLTKKTLRKIRKQFRHSSKEEYFILEKVLPLLEDANVKDLYTYLTGWYMRRSHGSKWKYYICSFLFALFTGLVPVLTTIKGVYYTQLNCFDVLTALLAFLASLCAFIVNLSRCSENWIRFRGSAESLKAEVCLFLNGVGDYEGLNDDNVGKDANERTKMFIKRILEITGSEKDLWMAGAKENKMKS